MTGTPGSQLRRVATPWQTTGRHRDLVHGRHPAYQRQQQHACLLRAAAGAGQHGRPRRRHQHLPRPRQRAGRDRPGRALPHLPGYYGLSRTGSWKHWARVWEVDYDYLLGRFARSKELMESKGIPVLTLGRRDVLEDPDNMDQPDNLRAMVFWGHAPNSQTRLTGDEEGDGEARSSGRGRSLSDRDGRAARPDRRHYLLPAARSSRPMARSPRPTARSNGATRWSIRCSSPSPTRDHVQAGRRSSVSPTRCSRTSRSTRPSRLVEDITARSTAGMWTIGYTGQSPERLKKHMANQHTFDRTTLQAPTAGRPTASITACRGRAGARRKWGIRARRTSMIPPSRWPKAV